MKRYTKLLIGALGAATLALTVTMALGWTSSSLASELVVFVVQATPL